MSYNSRLRRSRRKQFPRIRTVIAFLAVILLAASPAISAAWTSVSENLPSLDKEEEYHATDDTLIFDSSPTPHLLAVLHSGENRVIVPEDQIPSMLKQAIVVIEDDRFYEHQGFGPVGVARAIFANFTQGKLVEGGSTITQQYIKNTYVSNEPSINRKLKEAIYAHELEQKWSKDKILSEYLNTIYFGNGAYGIQVAATVYFNKAVPDLSIAECALLAAIPKSPLKYSPFIDPDAARDRRDLVLSRMLSHGMISQDEYDTAVATPVPSEGFFMGPATQQAPYFVEYVKEQLIARYGTKATFEGGLRVYTTLDMQKQAAAERAVGAVLNQPGDPSVALVSLEPSTSYIRAMVGGRDFSTQKFNVATQGHRQPGSAFKPFVLATAMNKGISPGTTFVSEPKKFNLGGEGSVWEVHNFDELYLGKISLEKATIYSDNAVYSELMMKVGPADVADVAHKAGINTSFSARPAIALGGLDNGVTPMELASSYGTFANSGIRVSGSIDFMGDGADPISIFRVTAADGTLIEENKPQGTPALDPVIAYHVNSVLKQVAMNGTGHFSNLGRPCAGKSGTTEDYVDAWFSGYTPDLVATVWVGFPEQRTSMQDVRGVRVTGGSWPTQIWNMYMTDALADTAPNDFSKPPNSDLVKVQVCTDSGQLALPWCPHKESRSFFPGKVPTETCTLHKPQDFAMPSFLGMHLAEAWKAAKDAGLLPTLAFKSDPNHGQDIVVDQNPKSGQKVHQGTSQVTLVVAGPPGSVSPPPDAASDD